MHKHQKNKESYNAPVLAKRSWQDDFNFYGNLILDSGRRVALDGVGIVKKKLVTNATDLIGIADDLSLHDIKGSLAIYIEKELEGVRHFKIHPDPLGACFIYKYEKNGVVAFSSDLNHLVDWLREQGLEIEKSVFYQSILLSINEGAFGHSSYEDIVTLHSSKYILAHRGQYLLIDYGFEDFLKSDSSYENVLDLAEEELRINASAISNSKLEKIAHLTGGMDSRLVIAAISSIGELGNYKLHCSGGPGNPDFDTAYSISGVMNAKMTNNSALHQEKNPNNIEDFYRFSSQDNQGMLTYHPTNSGMSKDNNKIILSGGYGECLRGYYLNMTGHSLGSVIENLWPLYDSNKNLRTLATESSINIIKGKLGCFLIEKMEHGWSLDDALQFLYMQEKNRTLVGNVSLVFSRHVPRFDPLYSIYSFKAAYKLKFKDRANSTLIYDLMSRLNPKLGRLKFGTTHWSDYLIQKKGIEVEELPVGLDVEFERVTTKKNIFPWLINLSKDSIEKASKIGVAAWHLHYLKDIQNEAISIISKHPEIYERFDKSSVNRLLTKNHNSKIEIRKVYQLYYSLVWLYK